jgi:hypothetical protein
VQQSLAKAPPVLPYTAIGNFASICTAVASHLNGSPPSSTPELEFVKEIPLIEPALPAPLSGGRLVDFDFDNDGDPDQVFWYEDAGRYIDGTMFYVNRGPLKSPAPEVLGVDDLLVFPCQFDKTVTGPKNCPRLSQDQDEAGVVVRLSGIKRTLFFRGRYTLMEPFRNSGKTYIILRSRSYDTKRYAAVIQPTGGTSYKSSCLFKRSSR